MYTYICMSFYIYIRNFEFKLILPISAQYCRVYSSLPIFHIYNFIRNLASILAFLANSEFGTCLLPHAVAHSSALNVGIHTFHPPLLNRTPESSVPNKEKLKEKKTRWKIWPSLCKLLLSIYFRSYWSVLSAYVRLF